MAIAIRALAAEDRQEWLALWQGYQRFYETRLDGDVTALTWSRIIDPDGPISGLAAEESGRLLGFTHYLFHPSSWTKSDYCYLQDLFVAQEARGRSVARMLIEEVAARAEAAGAARLYWLTHESNEGARALYDKIAVRTGFIQYRR